MISTWRKSKLKFNISLIKNIFSLGILHIVSLFNPKLYIKLYCRPCPPKESDFFFIEDINGNSSLCRSIHKRPKIASLSSAHNINFSKRVSFEYNNIKYEYDEKINAIKPVYFNISLLTNNDLIYKHSEGLSSEEEINILIDKYGKNEMKLNKNMIYFYFLKFNLKQLIITIISSILFIKGDEASLGYFILWLSILILLIRIMFKFIRYKQLYNNDNSLDGRKKMKKYKVIRKNMKELQSKYSYIYNRDILPGDILLLKEDDFIPCDCVILEGECLLSSYSLLGNTDPILRSSLESNNNYFNYIENRKNIIFHGMKIIKVYTKNNSKEITVLAINTGGNTFKANLFSNLIIKAKENKNYTFLIKNLISIYYIVYALILFILSISGLLIMYYVEKGHNSLKNYILIILGLTLMPINIICENLIKLISIIHLGGFKIRCTNETILPESANIDTVIFSNSGNKEEYKIIAFCPLYFEAGTKKISLKGYEQSEENINKILDSHMNYYRKIAINIDNNDGNDSFRSLNNEAKNEELNALFLQCLVCCTSLEKINNEICGEILDKKILEKIDWDINSIEIRNEMDDNPSLFNNSEQTQNLISIIEEIKKKGNIFINNYENYNINYNSRNTISEVFPKDYYIITEEKNINYKEKKSKTLFNKISNRINSNERKIFKLIIIHKFNSFSCWRKSCITYNLLDNKCRFMTKGPPDLILKHCISKSIPDIDKILSKLIKEGNKIIIFATKIIQLNQIDKNKKEEYYMRDLSFVGFIIIENKFKKEISQIVDKIDKMNCNNSINSVISTNDNIYNAIEGGLKNGIINKNNVFVFDLGKSENETSILYAKYIYDKEENEQKYKKNLESNKTLIKSIYGDKNNPQNLNNNNNQIVKKLLNDELLSSSRVQESSRKIINSDSNKEIHDNNITNTNITSEERKNINIQTPKPKIYKKISKVSSKNNLLLFPNTFSLNEREHKQSFYSPIKKNFNLSRTDDFTTSSNFGKEEDLIENDYLKYKKRRTTTKANLNFSSKNIYSYAYDYLYFRKYENQIQPFKHDCILCFSGKIIEFIYNYIEKSSNKNNYYIEEIKLEKYTFDILMTLLKDRVKIFYSMEPEHKSILVKLFRKYLKKSICFVGNSTSDIESIVLSNIGIMIGPPTNFNTLLSHYYLCDKSLLEIEKIFKNGRSFYENISNLASLNTIFTLLLIILILLSYKLNSYVQSTQFIVINASVFLLCLSGFSIKPDYSIDVNHLFMNKKLYLIYNIIKIIGVFIIKFIGHIILWKSFKNNEENLTELNNEILTSYIFIFIWAQITSIIFAFNTQSFFRKNILNNILFIFIFCFIFEYFILNLTLSDISIENYKNFLFISFEVNKDNCDVFEDNHKITILYIFLGDILLTYLFIKILKIVFDKHANKNKKINKN